MGKKKTFTATDISIPEIDGRVKFSDPNIQELIDNPIVTLPTNHFGRTHLNFSDWYGGKVDAMTYICQVQILRFIAKQDAELQILTLCGMFNGAKKFLEFLELRASVFGRAFNIKDIDRPLIDSFLRHLSTLGIATTTQNIIYKNLKSLLLPLGRRGIFKLITQGKNTTFPPNPFPNIKKMGGGAKGLTKSERKIVLASLRAEVQPIWDLEAPVTSELLTYCLYIVALHTGRNTTPLLEMTPDCLRPHPKDNTCFLVLWKRRGYNTSKVILRSGGDHQATIESMPSIRFNVERLIRQVIYRSATLREQAPALENRIWLYPARDAKHKGTIRTLQPSMVDSAIKKLIEKYNIKCANGKPLQLNISRLRKTFANRMFEIMDGDLNSTARALGNTPRVTDSHYLAATSESKKKWRFMGEVLVEELITKTLGATYHHTPVANCSHPQPGGDAHSENQMCTSFLNCVRCNNFVVTADDLYKLFSFYYRIYSERNRMQKQRWVKELSHIPRLIDDYVIKEGIRRGAFKQSQVEDAKTRARAKGHPFWNADAIPTLEVFY